MFIDFLFENFGWGNCGVGWVGVWGGEGDILGKHDRWSKVLVKHFGGMVCEKRAGQGKGRGESS